MRVLIIATLTIALAGLLPVHAGSGTKTDKEAKGSGAKVEASHDHDHDHDHGSHAKKEGPTRVTGEILDMACYLDHGARGKGHKKCAATCIKSGLPVGIKASDGGKTYLIIGNHKPMNDQLVKHAAEIITIEGKLVELDGISMIANARIVK